MIRITDSSNTPDLSLWSFLGRRVLSRTGVPVGFVTGLYVSEKGLSAFQILSRFRLLKIGLEGFEASGIFSRRSSLLLNFEPTLLLVGRNVYDREGRKLGRVRSVERREPEDRLLALLVRKGRVGRTLRIDAQAIELSKKNILLNRSYQELTSP